MQSRAAGLRCRAALQSRAAGLREEGRARGAERAGAGRWPQLRRLFPNSPEDELEDAARRGMDVKTAAELVLTQPSEQSDLQVPAPASCASLRAHRFVRIASCASLRAHRFVRITLDNNRHPVAGITLFSVAAGSESAPRALSRRSPRSSARRRRASRAARRRPRPRRPSRGRRACCAPRRSTPGAPPAPPHRAPRCSLTSLFGRRSAGFGLFFDLRCAPRAARRPRPAPVSGLRRAGGPTSDVALWGLKVAIKGLLGG